MRVKPFEQVEADLWRARFGRYQVEVRRSNGGQFWRGPDKSRPIIDTGQPVFNISFHASANDGWSSCAYTLPGAFAAAELGAVKACDAASHSPRYELNRDDVAAEAEALALHRRSAIEADRIAAARGWPDLALSVLPELVEFGKAEGLLTGRLARFAK